MGRSSVHGVLVPMMMVLTWISLFLTLTTEGLLLLPMATSEKCAGGASVVLGCNEGESPLLDVTYPSGEIGCGFAMTLNQSALEPTVVLDDDGEDEDVLYTLLLIDTQVSFIHPIIHYGAVNVASSGDNITLSDLDVFSSYRGPSPPSYIPGIQSQLFNYEWIVAKQSSILEVPTLFSNVNFDYVNFLTESNATIQLTKYFSSGFCVEELEEDESAKFWTGRMKNKDSTKPKRRTCGKLQNQSKWKKKKMCSLTDGFKSTSPARDVCKRTCHLYPFD